MDDSDIDYTWYAGHVVFPRAPADLTGTTNCPACFAALRGRICPDCGLDLNHPAADTLLQLSYATADLLAERLALIGRIRFETLQLLDEHASGERPAAAATAVGAWQSPDPEALAFAPPNGPATPADFLQPANLPPANLPPADLPPAGLPPAGLPPADLPPAGPTQAGSGRPRRSSVQVLLLATGVTLLSIAAIFFLVYAFINFGLVWRTVIIGAITAASFAGATLLRRRALTATAEGVAAFSVVLIFLDAYALRANDLFGLAGSDAATYWGATLVVASLGLMLWHRLSALRTPNIVGFAAFAPGVGLLVWAVGDQLESGTRVFLAMAAVTAAGLVHLAAGEKAALERALTLGITVVALAFATLPGVLLEPESDWAPTIALLALGCLAVLHVAAMARMTPGNRLARAFSAVLSALAGMILAVAVAASAIRIGQDFQVVAPLVGATAVALTADTLARHSGTGLMRRPATIAGWWAAAVTGITLLLPASTIIRSVLAPTAMALFAPWTLEGGDPAGRLTEQFGWAVLALVLAASLAALVWVTSGPVGPRGPALAWFAGVIAVSAPMLLSTTWLVVTAWLALAIAALALLVASRDGLRRAYRAPLIGAVAAAGTLGYCLSWASTSTWLAGSLVGIALLVAGRAAAASVIGRAALLGLATALLLIAVGAAAHLPVLTGSLTAAEDAINIARMVGLAASVLLASAAIFTWPSASPADRRIVFWLTAITGAAAVFVASAGLDIVGPGLAGTLLLPEYWGGLASGLLLLAALLVWARSRSLGALRIETIAASAALAPVLYLVIVALARLAGLPEFGGAVAAVTAALLAGAGGVIAGLVWPLASPRWARELGIAVVVLPAIWAAATQGGGQSWLVFVLAALTAFFLSISADGLLTSASPRRYLAWLALGLAAFGLWWRADGTEFAALGAYLLPLAAALLLAAIAVARSLATGASAKPAVAAPLLVLGALLTGIVPLAVNSATSLPPAIAIGSVSAGFLLVGSLLGPVRVRRYLDALAFAGAVGVIATTISRLIQLLAEPGTPDARLEAWLGGMVLTLAVAAVLRLRPRPETGRSNTVVTDAVGILTASVVLAAELPGLADPALGPTRAVGLTLLFAMLHVLGFVVGRSPFSQPVGWVAVGFAGIAIFAGSTAGALEPIEVGTVPVAVALLLTGSLRLEAAPLARSWPWLGPGTALLLLPSLIATIDDRPLWRLVALGVAAVAVVIIAARRHLQAPFLIGVAVALIHSVATFLPQLRIVYQALPWWLWLGAGGVVLIVLAASYERRIRDLKSVAMKVAALR